jgi:hypothetical protein
MKSRGFGGYKISQKKSKTQRQIQKRVIIGDWDPDILKEIAISGGEKISSAWDSQAKEIRKKTCESYGKDLMSARMILISVLSYLMSERAGIPGKTNHKVGQILQQVAIFYQGETYTEKAISEGQYIKASALIKQELEMLARIVEIKEGQEKEGKTPKISCLSKHLREQYGDMNDIAHIAKTGYLDLFSSIDKGSFRGVAFQPIFHAGVARCLYETHVYIFYNITLEQISISEQLYPDDSELIIPPCRTMELVTNLFKKEGFFSGEPIKNY